MRTREELALLQRTATSSKLAKKRHRSTMRFQRASQHAQKLALIFRQLFYANETEDHNQPAVTAGTILQVEIYALYMAGTYSFAYAASSSYSTSSSSGIQSTPKEGVLALSTAYVLLEAFAKHAERATDEALAFEMLDELEPMIRFCAYKADTKHDKGAVTDIARSLGVPIVTTSDRPVKYADLLSRYQEEELRTVARKGGQNKNAEAVHSIQWRDIEFPVRSAELSSTLGRVHNALKTLDNAKSKQDRKGKKSAGIVVNTIDTSLTAKVAGGERAMASYDRALATLSEAEERARKLAEENAVALSRAHSARFESATKPLSTAHSYIVFHLLSLRIQRDEALLASTLAKLHQNEVASSSGLLPKKRFKTKGPAPITVKRRRARTYPVIVKLLEGILQSFDQLRSLNILEEDSEDLQGKIDDRVAFDKTRRYRYPLYCELN